MFELFPAAARAIQSVRAGQYLAFDEGPVGDLEREALVEGLPIWFEAKSGFIYLALNASWPGLYKIGCTRRSVEARLKQLSGAGLATPWVAYRTWEVHDAHGLEAAAHKACSVWQVKGELFHAPADDLAAVVDGVIARDRQVLLERIAHYLPDGWHRNE